MLGEYRKGEHHVWLGHDCAIGKDGFLDPSWQKTELRRRAAQLMVGCS